MIDAEKSEAKFIISRLDKLHDKSLFGSRIEALNTYLKTQATQDSKKNVAVTYVMTSRKSNEVLGYYTLTSLGILPGELPVETIKKLPRYPMLPAILIGRLAVDKKQEGQGIGSMLLVDSFRRVIELSHQVGIVAVVVDAKNNQAINFYKKNGFIELSKRSGRLFIPIGTIKQLGL